MTHSLDQRLQITSSEQTSLQTIQQGSKRKREGQQSEEPSTSRRMQEASHPRAHVDEGAEKQSQAREQQPLSRSKVQ